VALHRRMFWRRAIPGLFAVLCVLGAFWIWIWLRAGEERALGALPAEQRAALFARTLANLHEVCGPDSPAGLECCCAEERRFALEFGECDAACFALARADSQRPTR